MFKEVIFKNGEFYNNLKKLKISTLTSRQREYRIYIRMEFKKTLGMNLFSLFQSEREFKVYKSCKCSQIICSSRVH